MNIDFSTSNEVLTAYLRKLHWIAENDRVEHIEKPGEGNMNMVARVITSRSRFILKQSRPYVQKYPQVAAPPERTLVEARFYEAVNTSEAGQYMPAFLGLDARNLVLRIEDLGTSADYTFLYRKGNSLSTKELERIVHYLSLLHTIAADAQHGFPDNLSLRKLNYEHLFIYPYMDENGLDLNTVQPGLAERARPYKSDKKLKAMLLELGEVYLGSGSTLLHGDYYPGSWLNTPFGTKIIDPEFCYFGKAEYDLGILIAHLKMSGQPENYLAMIERFYAPSSSIDMRMAYQFAGMEILRRIMGLAQLPLEADLEEREKLMADAAASVKGGQ